MTETKLIQQQPPLDLTTGTRGQQEVIIALVRLEASAQRAWYELALKTITGGFLIEKVSGGENGKGRQREIWFRPSLNEAQRKFRGILDSKINPKRRSPRKYVLVKQEYRFSIA